MREVIIFVVMFGLVLGVIGAMVGWSKFLAWREQRYTTVKSSPVVMSRSVEVAPEPSPAVSNRQTPDRPMMAVPTRNEILDIFKAMRAAGMKRESVSAAWRAAGLPFDNNLWTEAAPPPEEKPAHVTPFVGRPTNADFRDPELAYQPPPK